MRLLRDSSSELRRGLVCALSPPPAPPPPLTLTLTGSCFGATHTKRMRELLGSPIANGEVEARWDEVEDADEEERLEAEEEEERD